jgi:hypothetical protein
MSGEMESAPGVVKSHVCTVCSRAFSRLSALRRHTTDVCAASQASDAIFVKFDDDDDDDDEIDEEIIAKIDAYDDDDDDANDYVDDAHGSAKRRRRSAGAATHWSGCYGDAKEEIGEKT